MPLDFLILEEAHQEFWNSYHKEIEELGYNLIHGTTKIGDSLAIAVKIQGDNLTEDIQIKIRTILPTEYRFQNNKIPVHLSFSDYAVFH